jgi:hypothetical protein
MTCHADERALISVMQSISGAVGGSVSVTSLVRGPVLVVLLDAAFDDGGDEFLAAADSGPASITAAQPKHSLSPSGTGSSETRSSAEPETKTPAGGPTAPSLLARRVDGRLRGIALSVARHAQSLTQAQQRQTTWPEGRLCFVLRGESPVSTSCSRSPCSSRPQDRTC